MTNFTMIR